MRQIQRVVAALMKIILNKDKNSEEEVNIEINKLTLESMGLDINKVEELDTFEILNILGKNALTFEENSQVIAELLNVKGDIYSKRDDINNAYNCYLKCLEIYLYLSSEGIDDFIIDSSDRVEELENRLNQFVLPVETEISLFKHRFRKGQYSKAEDILFDLLQIDKSNRIIELGLNFYKELLSKDDEQLTRGYFSKKEIYQGIDELNRIKEGNSRDSL